MKKAKPEHRNEYWKYHVAAHSFELAERVASQLLTMPNTEPMFYPLMVSLHVFYARPFRHPKESRRIALAFVPREHLSVHDMLLQLRDRIFAHHDIDSRIKDNHTGVDLFQLIVIVSGGQMRPGVQSIFPTESQLGKTRELSDYLYCVCMEKAHKALIRCVGEPPREGIYRVSTEFEGKGPLLIRSDLSTVQSHGHLKETIRRLPGSNEKA
ncbi:MAG: hypothetical protein AB1427_21155 [Thermodesulfobacteriota bacterium]